MFPCKEKKLVKLLNFQQQTLFFLPDSPDLNPIEKYWEKLKKYKRKHQYSLNIIYINYLQFDAKLAILGLWICINTLFL